MPRWSPSEEWAGQPACIIGGGSSLRTFDFSRLQGRNTIGCNDAFRLGPTIVKICLFGDASWWMRTKFDLEKFQGRVACCAPSLMHLNCCWLLQMQREKHGLYRSPLIGWNYSTGAAAVNLALMLGANRVFLLGFDMARSAKDGKTHWHTEFRKPTADSAYMRFIRGFAAVHQNLKRVFPGAQVLNVTDGTSRLPFFPRLAFEQFGQMFPSQGALA